MKLGIMQPYFFPYIGYFQLINLVDKYVVYDDVNYIKQGWINRNIIMINGKKKMFNLILCSASPNKRINEINIIHDVRNEKKILKSLEMNYAKAPYYDIVYPIIENIISYNESNLALYLFHHLKLLCSYMNISTELILSSSLQKNNCLKGEEKVINICKLLKAKEYYNAIGGLDLYKKENFLEQDIDLHFLKTNTDLEYKQFGDVFIPNLSIIDVLMFNSIEEIKKLLNECQIL